jgi:hypothetical protein
MSSLGIVVTGSVYAAAHVALLVAPAATLRLLPHSVVSVTTRTADFSIPLRTGTALMLAVSMLIAAIGPGRRRPAGQQTRGNPPDTNRTGQGPATPDAAPRAASRYPRGSRRSANSRPNLFGPAGNNSNRWGQNRQFI